MKHMQPDPLSRPAVLELLQRLIQTPSVNPALAPGEAHGVCSVRVVGFKGAFFSLEEWRVNYVPGVSWLGRDFVWATSVVEA